jgi:radical SAM superfamily enzyme YgiQ (UPF0313 family)
LQIEAGHRPPEDAGRLREGVAALVRPLALSEEETLAMRYRHALCLYPYVADQRPGIGIFPPTGLEYVATAMKDHVGRISLVDLRHELRLAPLDKMVRFIEGEGVDLICISVGWKARYRKVCDYVAKLPSDRTIVVGGHEASLEVEDLLQRCPNVDAVVRGEGEQTIVEVADGRPWDEILGLSYRNNGSIVHNDNRPLHPIDGIVAPDRNLRRSRYVPVLRGSQLLSVQFDTILASRGCPYKCDFCSLTVNPLGQKRDYASRSVESVVEEIASSPAEFILFADDIFFLEPRKAEALCDQLIERGIKKRYGVQCRIEIFKFPRMLEKAYRAGFRVMLLGIESANDKILKQLHKGFTTDDVRKAFKVLRRFPFWYHAYFIYGIMGQTEEEMMAIPEFARELGVQSISLSLLRMDKFTPMRQEIENTPGYWISSNGYVYSKEFDKMRLRRIRNRIRNRFQYRPAQLARSLRALSECDVLTPAQAMTVALKAPVFAWDYAAHRCHKTVQRVRSFFKSSAE